MGLLEHGVVDGLQAIGEVGRAVPCPHAESCALRLACPQEFLRFYADDVGLADVAPVGLEELLELPPIPGGPADRGTG